MTVRLPNDEEKRRAALVAKGIWPGPPADAEQAQVGAKGAAEAKRRFGKA